MPRKHKQRKQNLSPIEFFRSMQTETPLPSNLYREQKEGLSDAELPDDFFLTSNIKKEEELHVPHKGMSSFMGFLNRGDYSLLQMYLQTGIFDPRGFVMSAYYSKNPRYHASIHLLTLINLIKSAVDELIGGDEPGDKVHCLPIIDENGEFSEEATDYLIPYLKRLFILDEEQINFLKEKVKDIPLSERFFATVEYDEHHRLCTFKMILKNLKKISKIRQLDSKDIDKLSELLAAPELDLDLEHLDLNILRSSLSNLLSKHPQLKQETNRSDFFNQLIFSADLTFMPVISKRNQAFLQLVVSPKIIDLVVGCLYGTKNKVRLFAGYGIFTARNVATATKSNARILNIADKRIALAKKVHEAFTHSFSLAEHDIFHWYRMCNIPYFVRETIIEFANIVNRTTNFPLSYLSFHFLDMDFNQYINVTEDKRKSFVFNVLQLVTMYQQSLIDFSTEHPAALLQYHLAIVYEILRNTPKQFKSFEDLDGSIESIPETILMNMCAVTDGAELESLVSENEFYTRIKESFNEQLSTAANIFQYIIKFDVPEHLLSAFAKEVVLTLAESFHDFKWTRNDGIEIEMQFGIQSRLTHLRYHKNSEELNKSFVIPFIKRNLALAGENRDVIVEKLANLLQKTIISNDSNKALFQFILSTLEEERERHDLLEQCSEYERRLISGYGL